MEVESSEKDRPCLTKMSTPPLACVVSEEGMPNREWVRSERRAENPERGRGVKIGFLDADKVDRMGRKKVELFSALDSKTSSIPLKNPERVRGWGGGRRTARSKGLWWGGRGRRYIMGRWGIRGLDTRVGESRGRARLHSGSIHVGGVRGGNHSNSAWGAAPRALNSERESCEHLRWTHLEQAQHYTDLPRQVTFPVHTEQGKMGPGLG